MPSARTRFEPGAFDAPGQRVHYDFPPDSTGAVGMQGIPNPGAGTRIEMALTNTTTDADFEAVYSGGTINVRVFSCPRTSGVPFSHGRARPLARVFGVPRGNLDLQPGGRMKLSQGEQA